MVEDAFIYAVAKDRKILIDKFSVCASVVSHALKFNTQSFLARSIRSYAVNFLKCPLMNPKRLTHEKTKEGRYGGW